mgnify:CR=1 FL=1
MSIFSSVFFGFIFISAISFFVFNCKKILRNINIGRDINRSDNIKQRFFKMLRLAFGQSKMLDKPFVGFLHLVVYVAFVLINIELIEIVIDGFLNKHRVLAPYLGGFYNFLTAFFEILALLVIISVVVFWIRRNILKIKRFISNDLKGWPKTDANYILYIEVVLMLLFPNTYFSNSESIGKMDNLSSVYNEVKTMLDPNNDPYAVSNSNLPIEKFGASDVFDLNWFQLLNAYTCTECGRCSSECPANQTGKILSPRTIIMKTRDRLEEVGKNIDKNGKFIDDGKKLLDDYISKEELWACTTCNACVESCPIGIDPLSIIVDMRRYMVMEQSSAPTELNNMMNNIENNGAPWPFNQLDRLNWKN